MVNVHVAMAVQITKTTDMLLLFFHADETTDYAEVTAVDTSTGDYQTTIVDETTTTITVVNDSQPVFTSETPHDLNSEVKTREYSNQGSLDYHDGLLIGVDTFESRFRNCHIILVCNMA